VSAAAAPATAVPVAKPFSFLRGFRLIPRVETYPAVLAFAQTIAGKIALLGLFGLGLYYATYLHYLHNPRWIVQICFLVLMTALPHHRRPLLTVFTLLWALGTWWKWTDHPLLIHVLVVLVLAASLFRLAIRFQHLSFGRRPVASLLAGFAVTVLLASYLPKGSLLRTISWDFLTVAGAYLWCIAYSLLDISSKRRDPFARQLGTYQPAWGSTNTPFPKGAAYLRQIEAQNPEQLATAQLKGLKLLAWSLILDLFLMHVVTPFFHGYLGIPFYEYLFHLSVQRKSFPWYIGCESLVVDFLERMIDFSIFGHRIVAVCRMAGFMALRNTYRPLSSRTIAEFWNRYYFYFKELLVDFFFYPTFTRYFKQRGRWRLFAATFAAACLGNVYFHFFRDLGYIEDLGFWQALAGFQAYIFYTIVLAAGIGISQMRQTNVEQLSWIRRRLLAPLGVIAFFCILRVFDYTFQRYPIQESFRFLGHLFDLVS